MSLAVCLWNSYNLIQDCFTKGLAKEDKEFILAVVVKVLHTLLKDLTCETVLGRGNPFCTTCFVFENCKVTDVFDSPLTFFNHPFVVIIIFDCANLFGQISDDSSLLFLFYTREFTKIGLGVVIIHTSPFR